MSEHLAPADVAGLVMLDSSDPERVAAEAHARACPGCAGELDAATRTLGSLAALEQGLETSPERLRTIRASIPMRANGTQGLDWRTASASVIAAVAVAAAVIAIFRGVSESTLAWLAAGTALIVGVGAIVWVRDEGSGRTATIVATAGSLALAMLSIEPGGAIEWGHAALCAGTQLVGALAPAVVALKIPSGTPPRGWTLAGRGAGGALVAIAAVSLVCPAHSVSHVIVFHVLSVGAAAAVATLVAGAALGRRAAD